MLKTDTVPVIKLRWFTLSLSIILLAAGVLSIVLFGGFNLGVDFESGLSQRIQIAPTGLEVAYDGDLDTVLSISANALTVEQRGEGGVATKLLRFSEYPTSGDIATALGGIEGISVRVIDGSLKSGNLLSGYGFPATLGNEAIGLNFRTSGTTSIEEFRTALSDLGNVRVQTVGDSDSRTFQIRLGIKEGSNQASLEAEVADALGKTFGKDGFVILQSDYIGPKFSATLISSSILAISVALALILVYVWIRFRFAFAVSAIVALIHDVLMLLTFISLLRLEFSSITIAALLTIIGYSLNNAIVIFDRIRENTGLNANMGLRANIDRSVRQSLSRTLMSSLTTLLAILPLAIFASGDIQLFAIKMSIGLVSGVYSSNLLAPSLLYWISKAQKNVQIEDKAK
ncbi:MAG TPA: protein translocase subunit SecF [Sphaerochaeta sp.]|nr:protein translocase subunit SecF [Sphaerochaeta sp.]HOR79719.1 protein translocase subunit SecF [Sphaerochaeta sp.]HPK63716.1 protein translocase subunit SecF [Sphaerochaeta sp.]